LIQLKLALHQASAHFNQLACVLSAVNTWSFVPTANLITFVPLSTNMSHLVVVGLNASIQAVCVVCHVHQFAIGTAHVISVVTSTAFLVIVCPLIVI